MVKWIENIEWQKNAHIVLVLLTFFALFFPSHILWSLCLITSVAWAVYYWFRYRRIQSHAIMAWTMLFFYTIICFSGLWADDKNLFLNSIRMKVIFLGLPFCFLVWDYWTADQLKLFSKGLMLAIAISTIYVLINYGMHRTEILANLLKGQPIPVPFKDHIRYSILLCFALIMSIHQADRSRKNRHLDSFYFWLFISMALFVYIQFLAVKTGMLISIFVVVCFVAYKLLIKRLYLKGGIVLIVLLGTVYFISEYIPTVRNKLSYFSWDLGKYKEKNYQTYSDGERIVSILKGFEIAKQNAVLGVGEGNLILHMDSAINKLPHNQFIVVWAQNGILGLMSFIALFILSFWTSFKQENWMAFAYSLTMLIANMLEPMLETQLGLTIFVIPLLILHSIELSEKN